MTEVVIAGIGQTEVGEHWEIGLRELALAAIQDAHQRCRRTQAAGAYSSAICSRQIFPTRRISARSSRTMQA